MCECRIFFRSVRSDLQLAHPCLQVGLDRVACAVDSADGCLGVRRGEAFIALTMIPMNRFSIVNVATRRNGMTNVRAYGNTSLSGRTIPIDQLSSIAT